MAEGLEEAESDDIDIFEEADDAKDEDEEAIWDDDDEDEDFISEAPEEEAAGREDGVGGAGAGALGASSSWKCAKPEE